MPAGSGGEWKGRKKETSNAVTSTIHGTFLWPQYNTMFCHIGTDNHYWDFLLHDLPKKMCQWQSENECDFIHAAWDVLNNAYHDQWRGIGEPIAWPPHLPDLNPLDFYLWGHLKTFVYAAPIDNEGALHHRIVDACQTTCNYSGIFE
jgi:hypothetical protein